MSKNYSILMGDVTGSSTKDAEALKADLKTLVDKANSLFKNSIFSPLTITLGDEFQGVTDSLSTAINIIFSMEELRLQQSLDFNLHYVYQYGEIDTEINPDIAHEMLGAGLTEARKMLTSKKRDRKRFQFYLDEPIHSEQLTRIFEVLDSIIESWKKEDFPLILDMINNENNQEVGELHQKTRTQIWKRRKTLMIKEYSLLKSFIFDYIKTL
ncbi:MAG: hypothetical protein ED557_00080 [Balneola sp.]|nr:MAG: hypothetical protein ED557_00080 [Balneola sp.]